MMELKGSADGPAATDDDGEDFCGSRGISNRRLAPATGVGGSSARRRIPKAANLFEEGLAPAGSGAGEVGAHSGEKGKSWKAYCSSDTGPCILRVSSAGGSTKGVHVGVGDTGCCWCWCWLRMKHHFPPDATTADRPGSCPWCYGPPGPPNPPSHVRNQRISTSTTNNKGQQIS
ncbi:hypothetical protein C0Q70_17524 [Pomacea canaliculata]|uniref:Uncharacterized protein n=1 Tax=Pomacea canaliculata TaxID=400727 RepID=A0A2T7NKM5_POMCA|nr:hypothetical protein C0Q70_17524 [Pomacea canaliculata]